jgi:restriction system protein
MELVAMLPWWVGVALALVSYLLLHRLAEQPVAAALQPSQIGAMAVQTIWKTLASVGQYLMPVLCVVAAGMSAWRRKLRQRLVNDAVQSPASDALDGMTWREFELLVGEGFRLQGYHVVEAGGVARRSGGVGESDSIAMGVSRGFGVS